MRISRDAMFSQICEVVAQRSTCLRSQVGAVIVKDGRIISMGYNGPVAGMPECTSIPTRAPRDVEYNFHMEEFGIELKEVEEKHLYISTTCEGAGCTRSLHAETNAIAFAAKAGVSVDGCTMYCTMAPCINCAKVIVNSGIKGLVFMNDYRDESGLELLLKAGVEVTKLEVIYDED